MKYSSYVLFIYMQIKNLSVLFLKKSLKSILKNAKIIVTNNILIVIIVGLPYQPLNILKLNKND